MEDSKDSEQQKGRVQELRSSELLYPDVLYGRANQLTEIAQWCTSTAMQLRLTATRIMLNDVSSRLHYCASRLIDEADDIEYSEGYNILISDGDESRRKD